MNNVELLKLSESELCELIDGWLILIKELQHTLSIDALKREIHDARRVLKAKRSRRFDHVG